MRTKTSNKVVDVLLREKLIAVIRASTAEQAARAVEAVAEGGITCIEITMTVPGGISVLGELARSGMNLHIGAGTVLTPREVDECVKAGAQFIVSPCCCLDVIAQARRHNVVSIPGAMSPTEILTAWEMGADMVKVFPASVLGPSYLKAVRGPLPQIPLVPTGGITADNAGKFIHAGAAMVCAGGWLVNKEAVAEGHYEILTERARQLLNAVRKARLEVS